MLVTIDKAAHDKMVRERRPVSALVDAVARAICGSRSCTGFECCNGVASNNRHRCPGDRGGYDDAAQAAISTVHAAQSRPAMDAEYGPFSG